MSFSKNASQFNLLGGFQHMSGMYGAMSEPFLHLFGYLFLAKKKPKHFMNTRSQ